MIIDAHTHVALGPDKAFPEFAHPRQIISNMDKNGIDKICAIFMLNQTQINKHSLDEIAPYWDRFIPFIMINPLLENADKTFEFCLDTLGVKGLKLHPYLNKYSLDTPGLTNRLLSICNERKLHTIIHCTSGDAYADPDKIEQLAIRFPAATFQLAHMGAIFDGNRAMAAAARTENLFVDTGIASFNAIRRAVLEIPEKVVMGADYPFYMFENELLKIKCACEWAERPEKLGAVCGGNISRILKL